MTEGHQLQKKIADFSPYLGHIMRRNPPLVKKLFDQGGFQEKKSPAQLAEGLKRKTGNASDFQSFCIGLRHFKQEEILRIAAQDLGGISGLNETTENLSALAQCCLQSAIAFCLQDPRGFKKSPFPPFLEDGLVVLGMGKLGGQELNFSSDIDLIFLYHPSPKLSISPLEQKEVLQIITRRVIQAMGAQIEGDHVFRVDMRLRPGGRDSDLVLSLEAALEYYQTSARTWERMAFIKALPLAGNLKLGRIFLKEIQPIIYRKFIDYSVLAEIRSLKLKILAETESHLLKGDDIKLGPGGIREIEFIVQTLQMVFGGKIPAIRERNTLKALEKLKEARILPREECRQLVQGYIFLRTLEHRLQMVHQRQTHSLPLQADALEDVARKMPAKTAAEFPSAEALVRDLDQVREKVRIVFENLLLVETPVSHEKGLVLLERDRTNEDRRKELSSLGFHQIGSALEIIESWMDRLSSASIREKTYLNRVMPLLLGYCLQTANPDQSLSFIDRFLKSIQGRIGILAMLLERSALAKEIVELFSKSAMMGRLFIQDTEMMDHLALQRTIGQPDPEKGPLVLNKKRGRGRDLEDQLADLRRWKSGIFLGTALEEMAGKITSSTASEKLSFLADRVLIETTRLAEEALIQEVCHPFCTDRPQSSMPSPFCILGLGKLGGQELGYASDLDLIFVYSLKTPYGEERPKSSFTPGRKGARKWITYHEYLVRLAQRLISYLSLPLKQGPGYAVDTRLRPSGSFGPLIVTVDAFQEYYQIQAQNWEKQALLKARILNGPTQLRNQVNEVREQILFQTPPPPQIQQEMAHHRNRMEKERSGENKERFNPKLGIGGLVDIEFITQFLQWTYGSREPELRQTNTLKVLAALRAHGQLSEADHYALREAYHFLNLLDHGLQLLYDRKGDPRTYSPEEMEQLVRLNLAGLGNSAIASWTIGDHYQRLRQNIRSIYKRYLMVS